MARSRFGAAIAAVLATLTLAALYVIAAYRFPFHGFWHDDGLYVQLGQSLAEGAYRLAQLPGEPVQARYPPLLPALLALVVAAGGDPRTAFWPFCVPGALAAAFGALLWYRFLCRHEATAPARALACVAAAALSPLAFLLCGCVMAEPLLVLLLPASLLVLGEGDDPRRAALAGVGFGLAMLAKQAALPPWAGAACGLLLVGQRRSAAGFIAGGLVCVLPWWTWAAVTCAFQPGGDVSSAIAYYVRYEHVMPQSAADLAAIVPARAADLAVACAAPLGGALLLPQWSPSLGDVARVVPALLAIAFVIGLARRLGGGVTPARAALLGSVGMMLLYPYATWRFLMPWTPLVVLLIADVLVGAGRWRAIGLVCFASANLAPAAALALHLGGDERAHLWRETLDVAPHRELARFVRDALPRDAVLACDYDPYYFVATGRRAVMIADFDPRELLRGAGAATGNALSCLRDHARLGVTHVLTNPRLEGPVARWLDEWERDGILCEVHRAHRAGYRVLAVQQCARAKASR